MRNIELMIACTCGRCMEKNKERVGGRVFPSSAPRSFLYLAIIFFMHAKLMMADETAAEIHACKLYFLSNGLQVCCFSNQLIIFIE